MATLSGPYSIDRTNPPARFYTPKTASSGVAPGMVLSVSNTHDTPGWSSMGIVSRQTPFGQGTFLGFRGGELRIATPDEIRAALGRDHPRGADFRPRCCEAVTAELQRVMGETSRHAHRSMRRQPALASTPERSTAVRDRALAQHQAILARWDEITKRQIAAVLRQIG